MELKEICFLFGSGSLIKCFVLRSDCGVGYNVAFECVGSSRRILLFAQRGGARLFLRLGSAVSCVLGVGFKTVHFDV